MARRRRLPSSTLRNTPRTCQPAAGERLTCALRRASTPAFVQIVRQRVRHFVHDVLWRAPAAFAFCSIGPGPLGNNPRRRRTRWPGPLSGVTFATSSSKSDYIDDRHRLGERCLIRCSADAGHRAYAPAIAVNCRNRLSMACLQDRCSGNEEARWRGEKGHRIATRTSYNRMHRSVRFFVHRSSYHLP